MELKNAIVFNRETEKDFQATGIVSMDVKTSRSRFDMASIILIGASAGKYIHFVHLGLNFYFVVNDDPKGYVLSNSGHRSGLAINNSRYIKWLFTKLKIKSNREYFFIREIEGMEWKGCRVFELIKK